MGQRAKLECSLSHTGQREVKDSTPKKLSPYSQAVGTLMSVPGSQLSPSVGV